DVGDLRRPQRVDDQRLDRLVPPDDVDLLAVQLLGDRLDARAADADAGADAVDAHVGRGDRDLGAVARLAGDALDLDHAVGDLGHLDLEEAAHDVGVGARADDPDAQPDLLHLGDQHLDAVADRVGLAAHRLGARQDPLALAEIDDQVAGLDALHDAGDDRALAGVVLREDAVLLGLSVALDHHLLRDLGADAPEIAEHHRLVTDERVDLPGLAIDVDHELVARLELLLGRGRES